MKQNNSFADVLNRLMEQADVGAVALANKVNEVLGRDKYLHKSTIQNWRNGKAKSTRNWQALIGIALALGLNERQTNRLLNAAKQPSVHDLKAKASDKELEFIFSIEQSEQPVVYESVPYLGLRTFQEQEAELFFGRETLVELLLDKLTQAPFLAVLGPSGSGKSSVVLAGLVPALKAGGLPGSEQWYYLPSIRPGADPLRTLAAAMVALRGESEPGRVSAMRTLFMQEPQSLLDETALLLTSMRSQPNQRLVLVVDQFEELWTQVPSEPTTRQAYLEQVQQPFIGLLLAAISHSLEIAPLAAPLLIIITMRADFLHRAAENRDLARYIGEHDVIVSPMQPDELRRAIEEPASSAGGKLEAGLVEELIRQTAGRKGALPLLSYTLLELWKSKRLDGTMTWEVFRALGGIEGALAARADTILATHYSVEEQKKLRHLLLRLVQPGEGTADTRRRVLLTDLISPQDTPNSIQALLKPLVDQRLLTTSHEQVLGEETVELSHEALIQAWPTFAQWLNEAREDLRFHLQLEEAAKEWQNNQQNPDFLWSGLRLANASAWLNRAQPTLNEREQAFLEAGDEEEEARAKAQEMAHQYELTQAQRLAEEAEARRLAEQERAEEAEARVIEEARAAKRLLGLAIGVAVMFFVALLIANYAYGQQQHAQQQANSARHALANQLATQAQATRSQYPQRSLLLAIEALNVTQQENEPPLLAAQQALRDGLANTGGIGLLAHSGAIEVMAFSPNGHWLATGNSEGTVHLWNLMTEEPTLQPILLQGHQKSISSIAFSPDSQSLATGSHDKSIRLWDLTACDKGDCVTSIPSIALTGHEALINRLAFSPKEQEPWLASSSEDKTARLWNLTALDEPAIVLKEHTGLITFSPDGEWLIMSSQEGGQLWQMPFRADKQSPKLLKGHSAPIKRVLFSPDNGFFVTRAANERTASYDESVGVWDIQPIKQSYRGGGQRLTLSGCQSTKEASVPSRSTRTGSSVSVRTAAPTYTNTLTTPCKRCL